MAEQGIEAHLVTTYPVDPGDLPVQSIELLPWDFSAKVRKNEKGGGFGNTSGKSSPLTKLRGGRLWNAMVALRAKTAPRTAMRLVPELERIIDKVKPDLVHGIRSAFEGYMASQALQNRPYPFLMSTWGNDFTLYASQGGVLQKLTVAEMKRADGLHPDCHQDLALAENFGWDPRKPAKVLPGNGGIRDDIFHPGPRDVDLLRDLGIPADAKIVLNARGIKPYVRTDVFFDAMSQVLRQRKDVWGIGVAMAGKPAVEGWMQQYGVTERFVAAPPLPFERMGNLFRSSEVMISPSEHDGTPNSVIEGMACGAYPIAGNIESLREWITDGKNGNLFPVDNAEQLAQKILAALEDNDMRSKALEVNTPLTKAWTRQEVAPQAKELYQQVIASRRS